MNPPPLPTPARRAVFTPLAPVPCPLPRPHRPRRRRQGRHKVRSRFVERFSMGAPFAGGEVRGPAIRDMSDRWVHGGRQRSLLLRA
jgi:hypothetical protein